MKRVSKDQAIAGLSIPEASNGRQFRTKSKTLVATGYEKVQRDDDGVVRVYFKGPQVYERNLVQIEPGGTFLDRNPAPARYNSKDAAKVEFLRPFSPCTLIHPTAPWNAPAADLYVDGVPVYTPDSEPEPKPARMAQIRHANLGGHQPPRVPSRTDLLNR